MGRKAKITREAVKKALISQLEKKGADAACYISLIEDYMSLWEVKEELKKDLDDRGAVCQCFDKFGNEVWKNNLSARDFVMVNKQMLSVLKELGLDTAGAALPVQEMDCNDAFKY